MGYLGKRKRSWAITVGLILVAGSVYAGNVSTSIEDSGTRVGIGTTGPLFGKLHIQNNSSGQAIYAITTATAGENYGLDVEAVGVGGTSNVGGYFFANGATTNYGLQVAGPPSGDNNYALFSSSGAKTFFAGSVGLGTLAPQQRLHVVGIDAAARIEGSGIGSAGLEIFTNGTKRWALKAPSGSSSFVLENSSSTQMLTLDQAGNFSVQGNLAAKYQDVAEWTHAVGALPPGMVVVIEDGQRVGKSEKSYDTRVAGVISPRPGLLLGEAGPDKVKVAHSGRVKVKADAGSGAIRVGDLLVTSATPGHAMRSEPVTIDGAAIHRPGTLLGKALEALPEGQGEILVLLMLQ